MGKGRIEREEMGRGGGREEVGEWSERKERFTA